MADPEIPDRGYNTEDVTATPAPAKRHGFLRRHWGKLTLAVLIFVPAGHPAHSFLRRPRLHLFIGRSHRLRAEAVAQGMAV